MSRPRIPNELHRAFRLEPKDLKAFHVKFTRYAREGGTLGRSEAIWVAIRSGECWKLKLRIGAARIPAADA